MYILYDIAVHLAFILLLPYFIVRAVFHGKYRVGIKERFGFIDPAKFAGFSGAKVAWFHAVSVGETKAVTALLKSFKETHPEVKIVFSTVTPTGNAVARADCESLIDALIYFPLDMGWVARKVVTLVNPSVFVVVEKELWPRVVKTLTERGVPMVVVNGTFSEKSFGRYKALSFFFSTLFGAISTFCARTETDARMARELGVPEERVTTAGNIKFDMARVEFDEAALRSDFLVSPGDLVIVAGSTHDGEEAVVLDAFETLRGEFEGLKLILAPRHPERFEAVAELMKSRSLNFSRRSTGVAGGVAGGIAGGANLILLDTLGELGKVYSLATVAFVGGTIADIGGHNLLEPALFGRPVVYGPHLQSYLYMAELLEDAGGGVRVVVEGRGGSRGEGRGGDLAGALRPLLADSSLADKMGRAAESVVTANRGATGKCAELIALHLKG